MIHIIQMVLPWSKEIAIKAPNNPHPHRSDHDRHADSK